MGRYVHEDQEKGKRGMERLGVRLRLTQQQGWDKLPSSYCMVTLVLAYFPGLHSPRRLGTGNEATFGLYLEK